MARRFRGESTHKVDAKGRVSIPAPFRRVLEEGDPDWTEGLQPNVVMVQGFEGLKCLSCFTMKGIEEIDDIISEMDLFEDERSRLEFALNNNATYGQVDDTGRIVLNAKLRDFIGGAGDEVVFSGLGDRFQIWEPAAFDARKAEMMRGLQETGRETFARLNETRRAMRGREREKG